MKKEKIKNIVLIMVVAVISSTVTSFATSNYLFDSIDVKYDNSNGVQAETVQGAIDELYSCASDYSSISNRLDSIIDDIYPVGSLYCSRNSTDPNQLFGGTWSQIKDRFILTAGNTYSVGSTGGSANAVLVSHTHTFTGSSATTSSTSKTLTDGFSFTNNVALNSPTKGVIQDTSGIITSTATSSERAYLTSTSVASSYSHKRSVTIDATHTHNLTAKGTNSTEGVSGTGKNMPPYIVYYCFERTN